MSTPDTSALAATEDVLAFWRDAGPKRWFRKDEAFDCDFRDRFLSLHEAAARGACDTTSNTPEALLGLVLLLDQFPRNAFRDSARAFATDARALALAKRGVERGDDRAVDTPLQAFFYMPFMHSENLEEQDRCVALCKRLDDGGGEGSNTLRFAMLHRDIVARFGRFPHRNAVLGRATTAEEQAFLDAGGFAG